MRWWFLCPGRQLAEIRQTVPVTHAERYFGGIGRHYGRMRRRCPLGAVIIGAICGVLMIYAVEFIDKVLKIDDPIGASSVHGVCGFTGTVLTGLFSTSEGLFYGAGAGFLGAQIFGAVIVGLWAAGMGFIIFKVLDKIHGLRVPARVEEEGLDIYEHGESAYN